MEVISKITVKKQKTEILSEQYLSFRVESQLFAIPVVRVRDVLKAQQVTKVPLAKPEILGFMNLRGRIVTVIDMRVRLGISQRKENEKAMFIVVENNGEFYCLVVDSVGESEEFYLNQIEKVPENLSESWKNLSKGVFKMQNDLMVIINIAEVINI